MVTITMPQLGESVTEGTILRWMKQPGDAIQLDDPLCEIETEKVTAELPSPYEGTMGAILAAEGVTVPVGAALCELDEAAAPATASGAAPALATGGWTGGPMAIPPERPSHASPVLPPISAAQPAPIRLPAAQLAVDRSAVVSPVVARLAEEASIDLARVTGTGGGGRVTRKDIEALLAGVSARPAAVMSTAVTREAGPAPVSDAGLVMLSATRRRIAENLTHSNRDIPQAWTMVEVDVTALAARRQAERIAFEAASGAKLTLLPYFIEAVSASLRENPALNATFGPEGLRRHTAVNAGIAVAAEAGLVVPVIHGAEELSVFGLATRLHDLVTRARDRKLRVADIGGGTITLNNTGAFGSIASKPLVNPPQVAIVTMERAVRRLVVRDDESLAIRTMMNVCLSFDHRALDGAEAGAFLAALRALLEGVS